MEGLTWELPSHADLLLQIHMQPSGKPEKIQSSVGIYFTDQAPTNAPFKLSLGTYQINIPAGTRNYEITDSYTLPIDVQVLSVLPHAHYLAREMEGYAILPDGRREWLLKINQWNFNWQTAYNYSKPVLLPKGSRLMMRFVYDNSSDNIRNPNQPPISVEYGSESKDEMAELWFQMLARTPEEQQVFFADYQHRIVRDVVEYNTIMLKRNPTNAHAHVQLGKALFFQGRREDAVALFRRAVRLDPDQEEAHYNLGVLAMDNNRLPLALGAFQETLRINPENIQALNNLGLILLHQKRFDEAEKAFEWALRVNPKDRIVKDNIELLVKMKQDSQGASGTRKIQR